MSGGKTNPSLWPVDPTAARGHYPESESRLLPGTYTYKELLITVPYSPSGIIDFGCVDSVKDAQVKTGLYNGLFV